MEKKVETADEPEKEENKGVDMIGSAVAVGNSKPFSALLGPAFGHLGDFLGKRTKEWVDGVEARRAKNTHFHVNKVKTIEHIPEEVQVATERQAVALIEWAEEAQKVDPEKEDDLSALWQGILGGIFRNEPDSEEMIAVLKQMKRSEARALLELQSTAWFHREEIDPARVVHFEQLGLLTRYAWYEVHRQDLKFLLTAASIFLSFAFLLPALAIINPIWRTDAKTSEAIAFFGYLASGTMLIFGVMRIAQIFGKLKLTHLGRRLRESGLKYWKS
jgi:hypothetical protein